MKINFMSDLHLEFEFGGYPMDLSGDILVLAGDIISGNQQHIDWIKGLDFKHIIFVAGNHEFYGGDIVNTERMIRNEFKDDPKVHYLNNEVKEILGVKFVASTLWTNFNGESPEAMISCRRQINDFHKIMNGSNKLTPQDLIKLFGESYKFLKKNVTKGCVVVTHHAPSFLSVHDKYRGSVLNGSFANSIEEIIMDKKPKYWIHGHMHDSFDYIIHDTRIVCNPKGYQDENPDFDKNKFLEV